MQSRRGRKPPAPLTPAEARERALLALSRREHGARELATKLTRQGADRADATEVVEALVESGWQSDERYAGVLVRSRIEQGYGPLRIRAELSARGVDEALIRAVLEAESPDWLAVIRRVHDRRYRQPPASHRERASRYRHLAARGFTGAQIAATLGAVEDEELPEDDDGGCMADDAPEV